MLVTVASYRRITSDSTTPDETVTARIEEAEDALADELDRPLAEAERTETLWPTRDGRVWPKAVPLVDGGDYEIDGNALKSTAPFAWSGFIVGDDSVDVVYTGGWVERSANPDAANRLPEYVERDLAWAAHRLEHQGRGPFSQIPAGVNSAQLGDVALGWKDGAPGGTDALSGAWSPRTLKWRHAPIGTRL